MASLRRSPNSSFWIACWRDNDGRQFNRSTKVPLKGKDTRRKAQRIADAYEAMSRGSRTAQQVRRVAEDVIAVMFNEDAPQYTVRAWFAHWLEAHKAITSPRAWERYEGQATRFVAFMEDKADALLVDVTPADIKRYRDARLAVVSLKTAKHEIDFLRRAFRGAVHDGVIPTSPVDGVKLPKVTGNRQTSRRAFTTAELRAITAAADPEWRSMVIFALYTGQRLGDVARLTWANLDTENGVVKLKTQKTGADLTIPIAAPLQAHIAALPLPDSPSAPIHPRASAALDRHGKTAALSAEFRRVMVRAGLVERKPHRKAEDGEGRGGRHKMSPISFHSLRHTTTSAMKNAGANNDIVMALVGHESESISREYTHAELEAMRAAANTLPNIVTE